MSAVDVDELARTLVENASDALVVIDEESRIVFANPATESVFGHDPSALVGESLLNVLPERHHQDHREAIREVLETGAVPDSWDGLEIGGLHADGTELRLDVSVTTVEQNGRTLVAGVIDDVTDRARREVELAAQRDELEALDRINSVLRDVNRAIVAASTRAEIERAVCRRFADAEPYKFAWIGSPRGAADEMIPSEWAGVDDAYLSEVTITIDERATGMGPTGRAYRTATPQVARDIPENPMFEPWRESALSRDFRSSAAIPLVYRETVYGVLNLYTARGDAFDDREVAVLHELGETIGHAMNAVESRRLLHADTVVQLEFRVAGDSSFFNVASSELDCTLDLEGVVPTQENTYLFYISVEGADPAALVERGTEHPNIRNGQVVSDDAECRRGLAMFEVVGSSNVMTLIEAGTRVQSAVSTSGESTLVAEVAPETEVSTVVSAFSRVFPEAELVRRHEVQRPVQTRQEFREVVQSRLTTRQRGVLEAALRGGYFARPRDISGTDLAAAFDVTPSTFHHHLQAGLNKVVSAVFDDDRPA